jgi:HNH endonuclease
MEVQLEFEFTDRRTIHNGYSVDEAGNVFNPAGKQLKPGLMSKGYLSVAIAGKSQLVHRLVAMAFLGSSTLQVNHKNGVKTDNRIGNLEYVTAQQNIRHSVDVLGNFIGERNKNSKLTYQQVCEIRSSSHSSAELGRRFGVSAAHVCCIRRNQYRTIA